MTRDDYKMLKKELIRDLFGVFNQAGARRHLLAVRVQDPAIRRATDNRLMSQGQLKGGGYNSLSGFLKAIRKEAPMINPRNVVARYDFDIDRLGSGFLTSMWADLLNKFGRQHTGSVAIAGTPEYVESQLAYFKRCDFGPPVRLDGTVILPTSRPDERDVTPEGEIESDPMEDFASKGVLPVIDVPASPFTIDPRTSVADFTVLRAAFAVMQRVPDPAQWTPGKPVTNPEATGRVSAGNTALGIVGGLIPWAAFAKSLAVIPTMTVAACGIIFAPLLSYAILVSSLKARKPFPEAMRRDGGRYAFGKLLEAFHGVHPREVTFDMVRGMADQYQLVGAMTYVILVNRPIGEVEAAARSGRLVDLLPDEAKHFDEQLSPAMRQYVFDLVVSITRAFTNDGNQPPVGNNQAQTGGLQNQGVARVGDPGSQWEPQVINPATGLPTIGGFGPDVGGNMFGHANNPTHELPVINPGSGLPTTAGFGTPDVGGNNWGESPGMHDF